MICVNFFAGFIDESEHTIDRLVDHIEHVASVAGIDHVGIGPDFLKEIEDEIWPSWRDDTIVEGLDITRFIPGLEGPRGLPLVTAALLQRGFDDRRRDESDGWQRRAFPGHRARPAGSPVAGSRRRRGERRRRPRRRVPRRLNGDRA